jgi:hypothetical protein
MIVNFLLILVTASWLISCGAEKDRDSNNYISTELTLNSSEEDFTSPSLFTINSNNYYSCSSAIINTTNTSHPLIITTGYRLIDTNKTICVLSDLPKDIQVDSTLEITYFKTEESSGSNTEIFTMSSIYTNQLAKNSILDFSNDTYIIYSDDDLPELKLAEFDYSGGASSMQYIFNNKFNLEFSESEAMRDLFTYGESDAIIDRNGFSLLDMKRVFQHYGYTAPGFRVIQEDGFDYIENDLSTLQLNTPFISPMNFKGTSTFVVILKINNKNITLFHPQLGYIQILFSELENGNLRNFEDWVVLIPEFIQE